MKGGILLASLSLAGCASGGCPAIAYPAVEVLSGASSGAGEGGTSGNSGQVACEAKLIVTDLDADIRYEDCERVSVNGDPGTYHLRIEYGEEVEERTVKVPVRAGECGGSDTVTITAFEK